MNAQIPSPLDTERSEHYLDSPLPASGKLVYKETHLAKQYQLKLNIPRSCHSHTCFICNTRESDYGILCTFMLWLINDLFIFTHYLHDSFTWTTRIITMHHYSYSSLLRWKIKPICFPVQYSRSHLWSPGLRQSTIYTTASHLQIPLILILKVPLKSPETCLIIPVGTACSVFHTWLRLITLYLDYSASKLTGPSSFCGRTESSWDVSQDYLSTHILLIFWACYTPGSDCNKIPHLFYSI